MTLFRWGLVLAVAALHLGAFAGSAVAAGSSYEFDQLLSLRGDCGTGSPDLVPDPGCPGGSHPPKGRFAEPRSIAIDAYGNEYVMSHASGGANARIDVFDDEGNFITEMVDPNGPKGIAVDSEGNLYAFEQFFDGEAEIALYEPTVYEPLAGNIEYDISSRDVIATEDGVFLGGVAIDFSNDHLYVSYSRDFIEEYSSAKEGNTLLHTIQLPDFPGAESATNWNNWIAVDGERRRLYASYCKDELAGCGVLALSADPPYTLLEEIDGSTTPAGKFLSQKGWIGVAVDESTGHFFAADLEATKNIYEFDQDFEYFATTTFSKFEGTNSLQIAVSNSPLNPSAKNRTDRGGYLFVPLPKEAGAAFAFYPPLAGPPKVEALAAVNISEREAELHGTIDSNGATTQYIFEYVTQQEFDEAEFANARTSSGGTTPIGTPRPVIASISDLSPGTSYRFRLVATNEKGSDEEEGGFRTFADAPVSSDCPNQTLRVGSSFFLPDCRAYELVTPANTNGRPPKGVGFGGDRFATVEVSPTGNTVAFVTEGGSLPGTEGTGGFNGDLYRTVRDPDGWGGIVRMGPSGTETNNPSPGSTSPDQEHAFFWAGGEGSAVIGGATTHYIRYPDGRAELIGRGSLGTDPSAVGQMITEGGTHIIFTTGQRLEPEAPPQGTEAIYDRTPDEVTRVVSLLPGDVTPEENEDAEYLDASADGAGIAFLLEEALYLRLDNEDTYKIGENVTLADVSENGEKVFYVEAGDLYAFDTGSEEAIRFTETGDATVVNVAPDGSRAYFVSTTAIAGSGENPNGATPEAGQQNLYLAEENQIHFVGTVTPRDVQGDALLKSDGLGLWVEVQAKVPAKDPSRASADGSVLLFQSRANLTGYDPEGVPQIYRYDSVGNRLHCVSCPPTGAQAAGGASLQSIAAAQSTRPPFSGSGYVPSLRLDGTRAFFESTEALVSSDTNGVRDVYEWEEQGVGSCKQAGGCVYIISSGFSAKDNYLYGVSRSGDDVFFITEDVLAGGDNDTASIYDARVGGGFPEEPQHGCQGEGCHLPVPPAPALTLPGVPAAAADDNVKPAFRCPRGKRKVKRDGKVRCVKKHRKKHKKKQRQKPGTRRGAGR